ncbi:MAG: hypothetical protein EBY11_10780 [Proteobacteria bacterium]|nr:hypothetical protein [Pseudomonadota bacterium]
MPGVDAVSVLEELRRVGKPATAVIYRRHGAHDETWGVTYADLKRVAKSLRGRSDLAEPLWASGIRHARHRAVHRAGTCPEGANRTLWHATVCDLGAISAHVYNA